MDPNEIGVINWCRAANNYMNKFWGDIISRRENVFRSGMQVATRVTEISRELLPRVAEDVVGMKSFMAFNDHLARDCEYKDILLELVMCVHGQAIDALDELCRFARLRVIAELE